MMRVWQIWQKPGRGVLFLGRILAVFFGASLALFLAIETMPEDPVSLRIKSPDPQRVAEIRGELGLDDHFVVRYLRYTGNFVTGDWGRSLVSGREVRGEIMNYFPATMELGVCAIALGILVGASFVIGGHASGWFWLRRVSSGLGSIGLIIPIYWIGILLVLLFAVKLEWLPVSGRYDFALPPPDGSRSLILSSLLRGDLALLGSTLRHLALPTLTLALYPAALVAGTLETRLDDPRVRLLVRSLRARGLSPWRIWCVHIPRLLSAPVVTLVGTQFGALLGGAVLTETVFSWPGMGRFLVEAVLNRDIFAIQNGLLLIILLSLVVVKSSDYLAKRMHPMLRDKEASR